MSGSFDSGGVGGFDRESSTGHLVNWAARLFQRALNARLKSVGASAGQVTVLLALAEHDSMSQRELVAQAVTDQSTLAMTLTRMERDGFVRRQRDPRDGRISRFALTQTGMDLLPQLYTSLNAGNAEALDGFSDDEKALLLRLLARVIGNIDAHLR